MTQFFLLHHIHNFTCIFIIFSPPAFFTYLSTTKPKGSSYEFLHLTLPRSFVFVFFIHIYLRSEKDAKNFPHNTLKVQAPSLFLFRVHYSLMSNPSHVGKSIGYSNIRKDDARPKPPKNNHTKKASNSVLHSLSYTSPPPKKK